MQPVHTEPPKTKPLPLKTNEVSVLTEASTTAHKPESDAAESEPVKLVHVFPFLPSI